MLPEVSSGSPVPIIVSVMFFAAIFLMVQAGFGLFQQAKREHVMNRRLRVKERSASTDEMMVELRKQRALDEDGNFVLPVTWFNQLVTRSGLVFQPALWAGMAVAAGLVVTVVIGMRFDTWLIGAVAGLVTLFGGPLYVLNHMGNKRCKKLSEQLPDALQIVTRSLEAGHPVPTAIALVAREMPDPIGTEFGMAADEIAYGFSLANAIQRLAMRSADPDMELFAATVRLQEKTGGNLCELLKSNGETVRERQTLRLKVKAASAEGRASAMILTSAPFIVGFGVNFIQPDFYGYVLHERGFHYAMAGLGVWLLIGNVIMRNMINFKF